MKMQNLSSALRRCLALSRHLNVFIMRPHCLLITDKAVIRLHRLPVPWTTHSAHLSHTHYPVHHAVTWVTATWIHHLLYIHLYKTPWFIPDMNDISMSSEGALCEQTTAECWAGVGGDISLLLCGTACRRFSLKQAAVFHPSLYLACNYANSTVGIYFPSPYLHWIDSSLARRGSYVKPGRLWLEINHIKWSARDSDYGLPRRGGR